MNPSLMETNIWTIEAFMFMAGMPASIEDNWTVKILLRGAGIGWHPTTGRKRTSWVPSMSGPLVNSPFPKSSSPHRALSSPTTYIPHTKLNKLLLLAEVYY